MVKLKKGQKLVCMPCGRELTISSWGVSNTAVWCCGKPMQQKIRKKTAKK